MARYRPKARPWLPGSAAEHVAHGGAQAGNGVQFRKDLFALNKLVTQADKQKAA